MNVIKTFARISEMVYNRTHEYCFKVGARMKPEDFTRDRKMDFLKTFMLILHGTKKGLQASVNAFINEMKTDMCSYSKQAFSQGRQKIRPEAFLELSEEVVKDFYKNSNFKTFLGFRVSAIDGVVYNLPNTDELMSIYGGGEHKKEIPQVQAQGSCLYDVLNGVLMDVCLTPYLTNERKIAQLHLERLESLGKKKELILLDRGYPSRELIKIMNQKDLHFLIRCPQKGFIKEIRHSKSEDEIITYAYEKEAVTVRLISLTLDNGKDETLVTNIFDKDFTVDDFKQLYKLRWKIETRYDDIKNKLQIENFSGISRIAVMQDFYASMLLANMAAFAQFDADKELSQEQRGKDLKYEYKTNVSMLISTLKLDFIKLYMEPSERKRKRSYKQIMQKILHYTVPIRSGRSFPRVRKHFALKFHNNRKNL